MKIKEKAERKARLRAKFMEGKIRETREASKKDPSILERESKRLFDAMQTKLKTSPEYQQMLAARAKLPAHNMKATILDALKTHQVLLILFYLYFISFSFILFHFISFHFILFILFNFHLFCFVCFTSLYLFLSSFGLFLPTSIFRLLLYLEKRVVVKQHKYLNLCWMI